MRSLLWSLIAGVAVVVATLSPTRADAQTYYYQAPAPAPVPVYTQPMGIAVDATTRAWFQQPAIQQGFTQLGSSYVVLAPTSDSYNCIAHTVGSNAWVWPGYTVSSYDSMYGQHGYQRTAGMNFNYQRNVQKVVLYGKPDGNGSLTVTHAALQHGNGWTSKLGRGPLIWHPSPYSVAGSTYGNPIAVYAR